MSVRPDRKANVRVLSKVTKALLYPAILCTAFLLQAADRDSKHIAFPDGFRQWTHVKSGLIDDPKHPAYARFGGIHHIYANAIAMHGFEASVFPEGSVLVFDLHVLRKQSDGSVDQGERRHVDVMVKDSKRFASTGGWGYEEFLAEALRAPTLTPKAQAGCANCHGSHASHDHVISDYRE